MSSGKLTRSESGKLGWEKSQSKREERNKELRSRYEKNPKMCGACNLALSYEKRRHKYCDHSCAARKNNEGNRRHGNAPEPCLNCGCKTEKFGRKFCSNRCQQERRYRVFIEAWLEGKESGITGHGLSTSRHIRRWLQEKFGNKCQICMGTEWMGHIIPLTIDHIDGSYKNNRPDNLRLICGNCGMQMPTFAGRNRGKGRLARKQWDDKLARVMSGAPQA